MPTIWPAKPPPTAPLFTAGPVVRLRVPNWFPPFQLKKAWPSAVMSKPESWLTLMAKVDGEGEGAVVRRILREE